MQAELQSKLTLLEQQTQQVKADLVFVCVTLVLAAAVLCTPGKRRPCFV